MSGTGESAPRSAGYERRDARLGPLLGAAALLVAVIALGSWATRGLLARFALRAEGSAAGHPMAAERERPGGPVLQADPRADALRHAAREREALESYGWIDPAAGIVRVPLARAAELVLAEGLPARAEEPEEPEEDRR
jgi:hypothetical protein